MFFYAEISRLWALGHLLIFQMLFLCEVLKKTTKTIFHYAVSVDCNVTTTLYYNKT